MSDHVITMEQLGPIVRRNLWAVSVCFAFFISLALAVAFSLSPRFKSRAALSIQASYFQNPLVNNLISDVYDPGELKAQRSALLRLALSESFLDQLGTHFTLFKYPLTDARHNLEREGLLKSIDYYSSSPTAFDISVVGPSALSTQEMNKAVLEQIVSTLTSERQKHLQKTRDAIAEHAHALRAVIESAPSNQVQSDQRSESLNQELQKIELSMRSLLKHFTDHHPEVVKLKKRAENIQQEIDQLPKKAVSNPLEPTPVDNNSPFAGAAARKSTSEVHDDLIKKLSSLDIVLSLEKDTKNVSYLAIIEQPSLPNAPFFPNKKLFVGFGFIAALFVSALLVFVREMRRGSFFNPYSVAAELEIPLLGTLPAFAGPVGELSMSMHPALPAGVPSKQANALVPVDGKNDKALKDRLVWLSRSGG